MKIEFQKGDKVTYFPYEKELPAIVKHVSFHDAMGRKDNKRVWYTLKHPEDAKYHDHVNAVTTGVCIKESKYFKQWDGKE